MMVSVCHGSQPVASRVAWQQACGPSYFGALLIRGDVFPAAAAAPERGAEDGVVARGGALYYVTLVAEPQGTHLKFRRSRAISENANIPMVSLGMMVKMNDAFFPAASWCLSYFFRAKYWGVLKLFKYDAKFATTDRTAILKKMASKFIFVSFTENVSYWKLKEVKIAFMRILFVFPRYKTVAFWNTHTGENSFSCNVT